MLCSSLVMSFFFFFSSRRRHTRCSRDWSSDVCSSDLWLKFGALVAIAFIFGLAFASTLGLPKAGGLPESVAAAPAPPAPTPAQQGAPGSAPPAPAVGAEPGADLGAALLSNARHVQPTAVWRQAQRV